MANEFDGLFSTPEQARNDYLSSMLITPQQQASQGLLQQVVSIMSNAGAGLGYGVGRLAGGQTPDRPEDVAAVFQEVQNIPEPIRQAQAAAELFAKRGMTKQAETMRKEVERRITADLEEQLKRATIAKTNAEAVKAATGKPPPSAQDERNRALVVGVETKLANGEKVDPKALMAAKAAFQALKKEPLYALKDGVPVMTREGTDPTQWAPNVGRLMVASAVPTAPDGQPMAATGQPTTATGQPTTATGQPSGANQSVARPGGVGSTVLTQPAIEGLQKEISNARSSVSQLDQIMNQGGKILDLYDKYGKDKLSPLNPNPIMQRIMSEFSSVTRSRDAYQASIDAAKAIETIIQMKRSSPTGATGFGALSERELETAQSMYSKLDPKAETYELDLAEYLNYVRGLKQKMIDDINKQEEKLGVKDKTQNYDQIIDNAMKLNPGVSRAAVTDALRKKGWVKD